MGKKAVWDIKTVQCMVLRSDARLPEPKGNTLGILMSNATRWFLKISFEVVTIAHRPADPGLKLPTTDNTGYIYAFIRLLIYCQFYEQGYVATQESSGLLSPSDRGQLQIPPLALPFQLPPGDTVRVVRAIWSHAKQNST